MFGLNFSRCGMKWLMLGGGGVGCTFSPTDKFACAWSWFVSPCCETACAAFDWYIMSDAACT